MSIYVSLVSFWSGISSLLFWWCVWSPLSVSNRQREASDPRIDSRTFIDLVVVASLALLPVVILNTTGNTTGPIRVAIGILFVFVLPGYALTAALFPRDRVDWQWFSSEGPSPPARGKLSSLEYVIVSVGLSLFVVPLTVIFLNFAPVAIAPVTVLTGVFLVTLFGVVVAAVRRALLPSHSRFRVAPGRLLDGIRGTDTTTRRVNAAVAGLLLLSAAVAGSTLATSQGAETYTEFYLLTENNETGELTAANYPSTLGPGEPRQLHVGVGNHESRAMNYTVVVQLQQVESSNGTDRVTDRSELARYGTSIDAGKTDVRELGLTADPTRGGKQQRLAFLLYRGAAPDDPDTSSAYRTTHIWVEVTTEGGQT